MKTLASKYKLGEKARYTMIEAENPHLHLLSSREQFCLDIHFAAMEAFYF